MNVESALTGLAMIAAASALVACGPSSKTEDKAAAAAPETPVEAAARIASTMTPREFKLLEISCQYTINHGKRLEGTLPADLYQRATAQTPMDFAKMVSSSRELDIDQATFATAQHNQLPLPKSAEEVTPEYIAKLEQCLTIAQAANVRDGVTQ